ncbi:MAG TPA: hypothetical protein VGM01_05890 [Ktedonobacteraceae bacterium]|jgi:hypothetical protein
MIKLVPMTELEFEMYLQYNIQEYAQDQVQSGRESEDEGVHDAEQQVSPAFAAGTPDSGSRAFYDY